MLTGTPESTQNPSHKMAFGDQIEKIEAGNTLQPSDSFSLQHPCDLSSSTTLDSVNVPSDMQELHELVPPTDNINTQKQLIADANVDSILCITETNETKLLDKRRLSPMPLPRRKFGIKDTCKYSCNLVTAIYVASVYIRSRNYPVHL